MLRFPSTAARPSPAGRFRDWYRNLGRRARPDSSGQMRIHGRQIYILPTGFGLVYGIMVIAMLLGANNYGSNPGFLFAFLLTGLGIAAMFQTWKNLMGLEITPTASEPVFCGNEAVFTLRLFNPSSAPRGGMVLRERKKQGSHSQPVDIAAGQYSVASINKPAQRRGWLTPGTVVVESVFPLGLFRAWAYTEPAMPCLVYPEPAAVGSGHDLHTSTPLQVPADTQEGDDFAGHRPYLTGDNMHHVDWKAVARGKGWHTKQFASEGGTQVWLRLQCARGNHIEERLSGLTRAVLEADAAGFSYGLDLPGRRIEPSSGTAHRDQCLKAIALVDGEAG